MVDIFFSYCWRINVFSVILFSVSASELPMGNSVQVESAQMQSQFVGDFGMKSWLVLLLFIRWQVAGWVSELAIWKGWNPGHCVCRAWGKGIKIECRSLTYFVFLDFLCINFAKFWGLSFNWLSRQCSRVHEVSCRLYGISLFFLCLFLLNCFTCQVHLQMEHGVAVF